tara:strand:- start:21621 stop:22193 length:573 start_codon:yes stop_codon:yes gene_type:complete
MEIINLISNKGYKIKELLLIKPKIYFDERGLFYESWSNEKYKNYLGNIDSILQENISFSKKGVIRGLHFQMSPFSQGKLVKCTNGEIFDVAVDLRKNSNTFGHWSAVRLNNKNKHLLWIPRGFAHGFLSLKNLSQVSYLVDNSWNKEYERTILWSDTCLDIKWPLDELKGTDLIISAKDKNGIGFAEFKN